MAAVTLGERTRLHQLHPAKLAVDWGTAIIGGVFLWRHDWVPAVAIGFGPPIVMSALFLSGGFDEALRRIRSRRAARSLARGLSPGVNAIRFGGLTVAWVGCWLHRSWWVPAGALLVAAGWWLAWRASTVGE